MPYPVGESSYEVGFRSSSLGAWLTEAVENVLTFKATLSKVSISGGTSDRPVGVDCTALPQCIPCFASLGNVSSVRYPTIDIAGWSSVGISIRLSPAHSVFAFALRYPMPLDEKTAPGMRLLHRTGLTFSTSTTSGLVRRLGPD